MDGHAIYVHRHAKNNDFPMDFAIFTKAIQINQPTDGPTKGWIILLIEMQKPHLKMSLFQLLAVI